MSPKTSPTPTAAVPLASIRAGEEVLFWDVRDDASLRHRLAELGLLTGVRFRVQRRAGKGPCVIAFGDTRLIFGLDTINRLLVRKTEK